MSVARKVVTTLGLAVLGVVLFAPMAFAADGAADNANSVKMFVALAAGLGLGIAAAGCGLAQGRCAAAAVEGIARNPGASGKIFTPMILGLALIESLTIYSLVISFMLVGKLGEL